MFNYFFTQKYDDDLNVTFSDQSKSERAVSESELLQGCQTVNSDPRRPSLPLLLAQANHETNPKELQMQPMRDHFSGFYFAEFCTNRRGKN